MVVRSSTALANSVASEAGLFGFQSGLCIRLTVDFQQDNKSP